MITHIRYLIARRRFKKWCEWVNNAWLRKYYNHEFKQIMEEITGVTMFMKEYTNEPATEAHFHSRKPLMKTEEEK